MAQLTLKKNFGPQGNAKVTLGKATVRVQMNGEIYEFDRLDWNEAYPAGDYEVSISKNLDKIMSLRPPTGGTHIVRFKRFGNRVGEIPMPKIQRGGPRTTKTGGSYIAPDRLTFTAQLEIAEGSQYDGLTLVDFHTYGFEPTPGSGDALITMDSQKDLEKFELFMRSQGINLADLVIPYAPNVLPWLEAYLQENAKPFMVTTNAEGWIATRSTVPAHLLPQTKKTGKRQK